MRTLIVDRFEGSFAICEDPAQAKAKEKDKRLFGIERSELPANVKEGDVLCISDEGEITIDTAQTQSRRDMIAEKQRRLKK